LIGYKPQKLTMKIRFIINRLSNPRVRRRLKIALCIWFGGILLAILFKVVYDLGYFDAQSLKDEEIAALPTTHPVLTPEAAQRIVTGALKEDPTNPETIVDQIVNNNPRLATVIIEKNRIKKVAWIIDMRMFFAGELYNDAGYNLNEGIEREYNLARDNFNRGDQ
jgi:hypothetical protein